MMMDKIRFVLPVVIDVLLAQIPPNAKPAILQILDICLLVYAPALINTMMIVLISYVLLAIIVVQHA